MKTEYRKKHWEGIYGSKLPEEVSWYQRDPVISIRLIEDSKVSSDDAIIDVGGGASRLVDFLFSSGFRDLTVLDISESAMRTSRRRLGINADLIEWIAADILEFMPSRQYSLWHDRAVFHFLVEEESRTRYVDTLKRSLVPGAGLVMATFSLDGPDRCSNLPVERYGVQELSEVLGSDFHLVSSSNEKHETPWGSEQSFTYTLFRYAPIFV